MPNLKTFLFADLSSRGYEKVRVTTVHARDLERAWAVFLKWYRNTPAGDFLDDDLTDAELRANMEEYIQVVSSGAELREEGE